MSLASPIRTHHHAVVGRPTQDAQRAASEHELIALRRDNARLQADVEALKAERAIGGRIVSLVAHEAFSHPPPPAKRRPDGWGLELPPDSRPFQRHTADDSGGLDG